MNTDTEEDSVVIYKNDKNGNQLATVNRYEIPSDKKDSTYVDIDVTLGDNRLNENVVNHYNALNQLTQTLTKNYKVSFTYDAEGLRTSKTVNGEKTVFVWDGDQLVMELSESGKVQKRYIRGNDLVYADKGNNTEKQYYVTDPHGNVVQLTDENGAVIKTYEYDSFGNEVDSDSKDENPFRYCGEYYDKETEEIYLRARYYQPEVGRFLTRDSYTGEENEPESLHLYTYCENDGVNNIDPSGHWNWNVHKKITKKVIAGVKKQYPKRAKKFNMETVVKYSIWPDQVRDKHKEIAKLPLNDHDTNGRWHGKNTFKSLRSFEAKVMKKINKTKNKTQKSKLMACIIHSIEDWHAHSYAVSINYYRKHYDKYSPDDPEVEYHKDRKAEVKNKKIIGLGKFNPTIHSKFKDNANKDFNKKTGKWKNCKFSTNTRIKDAIKEGIKYFGGVKK